MTPPGNNAKHTVKRSHTEQVRQIDTFTTVSYDAHPNSKLPNQRHSQPHEIVRNYKANFDKTIRIGTLIAVAEELYLDSAQTTQLQTGRQPTLSYCSLREVHLGLSNSFGTGYSSNIMA